MEKPSPILQKQFHDVSVFASDLAHILDQDLARDLDRTFVRIFGLERILAHACTFDFDLTRPYDSTLSHPRLRR